MSQRFYYGAGGAFLGAYEGPETDNPFAGNGSSDIAPPDARAIFSAGVWQPGTAPVPEQVTKLQLARAIRALGGTLWSDFKTALAADANAQEDWDLANEIRRDDPLVAAFGAGFSLDAAALDQLFITAANS